MCDYVTFYGQILSELSYVTTVFYPGFHRTPFLLRRPRLVREKSMLIPHQLTIHA